MGSRREKKNVKYMAEIQMLQNNLLVFCVSKNSHAKGSCELGTEVSVPVSHCLSVNTNYADAWSIPISVMCKIEHTYSFPPHEYIRIMSARLHV